MKAKSAITLGAIVALAAFAYLSSQSAPVISDEEHTYVGNLVWYNSYEKGLRLAEEQNKPVMLYFWATWCKFCRKLESEVFPDPEVNAFLRQNFVLVAVNVDTDKQVTSLYGVQYPPAMIFITPQERVMERIMGYVPKDTFFPTAKRVLERYQQNSSERLTASGSASATSDAENP